MRKLVISSGLLLGLLISPPTMAQQSTAPQASVAEQSLSAAMTQIQTSIWLYSKEKKDQIDMLEKQIGTREAEWHQWLLKFCGNQWPGKCIFRPSNSGPPIAPQK